MLRAGVALRSDGLNRLGDEDLGRLAGLGLRRIVDLRSRDEVREAGADRTTDGMTLHHLPVFAVDFDIHAILRSVLAERDPAGQRALLGDGRAGAMMTGLYRWFVTDSIAREQFGRVLRLLAEPGASPLLFHCSAGKDRTGWTAAVLLTALGVDRETVFTDYLLTNERSAAVVGTVMESLRVRGLMSEPELLLPVFRAERHYLEAAFEEVGTGWPDFDAFWADGLGLGGGVLAGLRANLLEPGPPSDLAAQVGAAAPRAAAQPPLGAGVPEA